MNANETVEQYLKTQDRWQSPAMIAHALPLSKSGVQAALREIRKNNPDLRRIYRKGVGFYAMARIAPQE